MCAHARTHARAHGHADTKCTDTVGWMNPAGHPCSDYETKKKWCKNGRATPGQEWTLGKKWSYPEHHCCACGKPPGGILPIHQPQKQSGPKLICGKITGEEEGEWVEENRTGFTHLGEPVGKLLRYELLECKLRRISAAKAQNCLAGKRVLFIGDSVMRYQYMSLITYLHTGEWPAPMGGDMSVCMEHEWARKYKKKGWNKYFELAPKRFGGWERCDCINSPEKQAVVENRFYYNNVSNFGITFLVQRNKPLSGHLPINFTSIQDWVEADMLKKPDWYGELQDILPTVVKSSHGPVDFLLWGQNIWSHPSPVTVKAVIDASRTLIKPGGFGIWKGATARSHLGNTRTSDRATAATALRGDKRMHVHVCVSAWQWLCAC